MKLACRNDGGGGSQGCVQVTSADFCRMREIESERMFQLVYVGRLLWIGGDSLLMPIGGSVAGGFTGKGESDVWVVWVGT